MGCRMSAASSAGHRGHASPNTSAQLIRIASEEDRVQVLAVHVGVGPLVAARSSGLIRRRVFGSRFTTMPMR